MPIPLYIPQQPANGPDTFSFTLVQQGTTRQYTLKKRLAENTVADLRALAKKMALCDTGRMKKAELAAALEPYVAFKTRAEAEAAWPILSQPAAEQISPIRRQIRDLMSFMIDNDAVLVDYLAHFHARIKELNAEIKKHEKEAADAKDRAEGRLPPFWWRAGDFETEDRWLPETHDGPYLKVVVEVTESAHEGYCSGIERDDDEDDFVCCFNGEPIEITQTKRAYVGAVPLKDANGNDWDFGGPSFDPGWGCVSGGSGVCGIHPIVRFVSVDRVE